LQEKKRQSQRLQFWQEAFERSLKVPSDCIANQNVKLIFGVEPSAL
jgi:hypothetical protein